MQYMEFAEKLRKIEIFKENAGQSTINPQF